MIKKLENYIEGLKRMAIAYSGGVDSTFLLDMSARVLREGKVLALTIKSPLTPLWEVEFAIGYCKTKGIRQLMLDGSFILDDELFVSNPLQRCYYCKKRILEVMKEEIPDDHVLLTGTTATDASDFRPGMKAEQEMEVRTPLRELGFTRDKIREYSKAYHIPGFERPPSACFATRVPYGEPITLGKVKMVEEAETFIRNLGIELVRVRLITRDTACIEVAKEDIKKIFDLREDISHQFGEIGFLRVTLDLDGYRRGKLNYGADG